MRKTKNWKHVTHNRKQWGTAKTDKRNTPFMVDMELWEHEMQYGNTDDNISEEE